METTIGRDVQVYLLVKCGREREVERLMDALPGYSGVENLFKADSRDEAVRMVRNLHPDTVVLDRTVFKHRGIDTLLPIIRDRRLSVLIIPPPNGSQYSCLGLDFGIMTKEDGIKDALRRTLDELYS